MNNSLPGYTLSCNLLECINVEFDMSFRKSSFLIVEVAAGSIREQLSTRFEGFRNDLAHCRPLLNEGRVGDDALGMNLCKVLQTWIVVREARQEKERQSRTEADRLTHCWLSSMSSVLIKP